MKKIILILGVLIFSSFLVSCDKGKKIDINVDPIGFCEQELLGKCKTLTKECRSSYDECVDNKKKGIGVFYGKELTSKEAKEACGVLDGKAKCEKKRKDCIVKVSEICKIQEEMGMIGKDLPL